MFLYENQRFKVIYKLSYASVFFNEVKSASLLLIMNLNVHGMSVNDEKLSVLSEMIAFAKIDKELNEAEYNFLLGVSRQLGVGKEEFDTLFARDVKKIIPKTEPERILQFHRLVLLMNIDEVEKDSEILAIRNIGLGMGLPPDAIERVLGVMHEYPNKIVPPKVLLSIFKTYYN